MYIKLGKNHKGRSILKQELQVIPKEKCNALPDSSLKVHSWQYQQTKYVWKYWSCAVYVVVNFLFQVIFVFLLFLGMVIFTDEVETKEK